MSGREVFSSVKAMVEPSVLAGLLGRPVESVVLEPMETKGWSSTEAVFEAVLVDGEPGPVGVIKRIRWSTDWHAMATDDTEGREVAIWESGVLDRLPIGIGHGVLAAARFDDGAALLMRNLDAHFLPDDTDVTADRATGVLRSMASMHASFWEDPPIRELGAATCSLERMIGRISPSTLAALQERLPDNELVSEFPGGWDSLPTLIDPGVARDLQALADDPGPVVAALAEYPTTLLHGDLRIANVAWDGRRGIPVDWQPMVGPPAFDPAYFVWGIGAGRSGPLHPDRAMALYRGMLQDSVGPGTSWSWWDDHVDVCITAVMAMMAGVHAGFDEPRYDPQRHPEWSGIRWWADRAQPGLRLIERG